MTRTTTLAQLAFVLSFTHVALQACTSDKSPGGNGADASTGGTGGTSGAGGAATGGTTGADASTGGTSSGGKDAGFDGAPDGARVGCTYASAPSDAGLGTLQGVLLVGGTNYTSTTEVVALSPATGAVLGRVTYADGDAVPAASGGVGFVLERTNGALDVLTSSGAVAHKVALTAADGGTGTNPHHVVVVPGSSPRKAYVSLYNANAIAVVDIDAGTVKKTIDLSSYLDPTDSDGSVDVDSGLYDAATGRAYFALERIDLNTAWVAPYEQACPPVPALVVAIDPATDMLVDLNGSDAGTGFSLGLVSPSAMVQDPGSGKALILAEGCFKKIDGGSERVLHGVESLDLATGATTTLLSPTSPNLLADLEILGAGTGVIESYAPNYSALWNGWNVDSPALGPSYSCIPEQSVVANQDTLFGATFTGTSASVIAYRLSQGSGSVLVQNIFQASTSQNIAGVALVK